MCVFCFVLLCLVVSFFFPAGFPDTLTAVTDVPSAVTYVPSAVTDVPSSVTDAPSAVTDVPSAVSKQKKNVGTGVETNCCENMQFSFFQRLAYFDENRRTMGITIPLRDQNEGTCGGDRGDDSCDAALFRLDAEGKSSRELSWEVEAMMSKPRKKGVL